MTLSQATVFQALLSQSGIRSPLDTQCNCTTLCQTIERRAQDAGEGKELLCVSREEHVFCSFAC